VLARTPRPRGSSMGTLLACSALLGAAGAAPAAAEEPGAALPTDPPVITSVTCVRACPAPGKAAVGSLVRVRGTGLAGTRQLLFYGRRGAADNRGAAPARTAAGRLSARVPAGARSGRVAVISADGQLSRSTRTALRITAAAADTAPVPMAASESVQVELTKARAFYGARRHAGLRFTLTTPAAEDVRVDLVDVRTSASVAHWIAYDVPPGTPQTVRWNGRAAHRMAAAGRYEFRVAVGPQPEVAHATAASGAPAQSASTTPPPPENAVPAGRFTFLDDIFPIRGRHDYGSAGNRFGAGRAGHTHQGQDVLAACGTRLVAERGGRVKYKAYQSAAGNYVVIDDAGTDVDSVYMHLREPAVVREGQHVFTGQTIGHVGDTGDATACHLHFEMWSGPGWYSGGSPFDPLPYLQAWDRKS
jgi:murein DD-endopeptidase MepM/ murein hydrolase activator NlpD